MGAKEPKENSGVLEKSPKKSKSWQTKDVLNFKEALALLGISASTLYKLTHKKAITYYKPSGKLIFFRRKDLMDWMLQNKQPSNKEVQDEMFNLLSAK